MAVSCWTRRGSPRSRVTCPAPSTTVPDGSCGSARARYRMRIRTAAPSRYSSRSCLGVVCGLDAFTGTWTRGSNVSPSWGRRAITGKTVKPRHLWTSRDGGRLPVFLDDGRRLGVGRGRRGVSRVLGWLRAGNEHLALLTNGRQWGLLFAGLDYDAWCEWDLDLWFEEGEFSPARNGAPHPAEPRALDARERRRRTAAAGNSRHSQGTGGTLRGARRAGARSGRDSHPRSR